MPRPVGSRSVENSAVGVSASKRPSVVTLTAINSLSAPMKNSSRPSARHCGSIPPLDETCHELFSIGGHGRTETSVRPGESETYVIQRPFGEMCAHTRRGHGPSIGFGAPSLAGVTNHKLLSETPASRLVPYSTNFPSRDQSNGHAFVSCASTRALVDAATLFSYTLAPLAVPPEANTSRVPSGDQTGQFAHI